MKQYTFTKTLCEKYYADVIVCGGGTSGAFAAMAAADEGKSVIIVEQFGGLGGTATQGLVNAVMSSYIDGEPKCSYLANELNAMLMERGGLDTEFERIFDPTLLKICLEEMCTKRGIKMLFHTSIFDVVKDGERIEAILVTTKSGTFAIGGKVFIDATGDGDVSVLAGAKYTKGNPETGKTQPISLRYLVDGIDMKALCECFHELGRKTGILDSYIAEPDYVYCANSNRGVSAFTHVFEEAIANGDLIPEDSWYWQGFIIPGRKNAMAFNNPEFFEDVDGTDTEHLTRTQVEGKAAIYRQLRFYKKYFRGFENAYIAEIASQVGIRESRHIETEYVLTARDLLTRRKFEDSFCQSNYPVDVHGFMLYYDEDVKTPDDGKPYFEIPCRSMIVKGFDNLIVSGRCLGSEFIAQAAIRVQQSMRAAGEAAGIMAAMAIDNNCAVKETDVYSVRGKMIARGADFID